MLRLYVKILDDRRHGNCRIVHISHANKRMFSEWSMGVIDSDPLEFHHVTELLAHRLESVQEKAFIDVMRAFRSKLKPSGSMDAEPL